MEVHGMEYEEQPAASKTLRTDKSREYWRGEVQRWGSSGLTQKEYCNKEGLSLDRFGTWKRRFDREGQSRSGALVAVPSGIVSSALLERRQRLGLVVSERYRVEIPDTFSSATLEQVLQVLARL
jgi:hypothetical protein